MIGTVVQRVTSPVFVGREAEVDVLLDALARARASTAGTVLIGGEAGIGKTRLVAELARHARERGAIVLEGACISLGADDLLPFGPIAAALRALVRDVDPGDLGELVDASTGELARLVPELGGTPDDASLLTVRPDWARTRVFEGLLTLLGRVGRRMPVVLVVEDLHWADRSTRDVLAFLARNARAERLLVVGTYRTDELSRRHPLRPWLAEMDRLVGVVRVELARLDRDELERLMEAILGRAPTSELSAAIARRSGGNPFFAEELLAVGALGDADRLPDDLRDVLLARFGMLGDATQEVMRVAAVSGPSVDHDLLLEVAGADEATVAAALREALEARLIVPVGDRDGGGYAFRHALVQEAVYDDVLPRDRRAHHAAYCAALARRPLADGAEAAGQLAAIAHHATAAHELARALRAWIDGARASGRAYAMAESAAAYERALDLWDAVPADDRPRDLDAIGLMYEASMALIHIGDLTRACDLAARAVQRFDPTADPLRAALLRERLGRALWLSADLPAAVDVLNEAVALLAGLPPSSDAARVISGLAGTLMVKDQYRLAADHAERAARMAAEVGARDVEAYSLNTLGVAVAQLGECERGIRLLRESMAATRQIDRAHDLHRAYSNLATVLQDCGDGEEAVAVALEGVAWARRLGMWRLQGAFLEANAASALIDLGRWEEARALLDRADGPVYEGVGRLNQAIVAAPLAIRQGRVAAARDLLMGVYAPIQRLRDAQFTGPMYLGLIELAIAEGRAADVALLADEALERMSDTDDVYRRPELLALAVGAAADRAIDARAHRRPDDEARARADGERHLAALDDLLGSQGGCCPTPLADRAHASRATAEAEAGRMRGENDPATWRAAVARWTAVGHPFPIALARFRLAEATLGARGSRSDAADDLAAARRAAAAMGAAPLVARIDQLARFARLDLDPSRPAGGADRESDDAGGPGGTPPRAPFGLTARELEVLTQLVAGRSNRQIGELLFISESTVGVHVSNILGKLGVTSRVEAAAIAARNGIGESHPD